MVLAYDPARSPTKGPIAARVYRVSDGLLVNLAMVKGGWGVIADDTPVALQGTLWAAEQEAMADRRGLWSPAARDTAAALDEAVAKRHEEAVTKRRRKLHGK